MTVRAGLRRRCRPNLAGAALVVGPGGARRGRRGDCLGASRRASLRQASISYGPPRQDSHVRRDRVGSVVYAAAAGGGEGAGTAGRAGDHTRHPIVSRASGAEHRAERRARGSDVMHAGEAGAVAHAEVRERLRTAGAASPIPELRESSLRYVGMQSARNGSARRIRDERTSVARDFSKSRTPSSRSRRRSNARAYEVPISRTRTLRRRSSSRCPAATPVTKLAPAASTATTGSTCSNEDSLVRVTRRPSETQEMRDLHPELRPDPRFDFEPESHRLELYPTLHSNLPSKTHPNLRSVREMISIAGRRRLQAAVRRCHEQAARSLQVLPDLLRVHDGGRRAARRARTAGRARRREPAKPSTPSRRTRRQMFDSDRTP